MRPPHFNSRPYNPNNRPQIYGTNPPTPQQVMANPGNFCPNPMQMLPQFQMGLLNNPQFAMPPFTNQNAFFAPNQLLPFAQAQMQNFNNNQLQQLLMHNALNMPQFQPNGQLNMPNLVQNANQLLQMQMASGGPQFQGPLANAQLGVNFNGNMQPPVNGNGVVKQPVNGNDSKQVNSDAAVSQGNVGAVNGFNNTGMNWKNSPNKNSNWNPKHDTSQRGYTKQPFHQGQNAKGNFKFHNKNRKEQENGAKNFTSGSAKPNQEGKKRSLALNYTAQEIQQWREERKKNYPSKANMEKVLKEEAEQEVVDAATKARRQQLKEILAKQAELGCEVAEIPFNYLSDSEQQANGRGANKRVFTKRERFQNKFDKRGKFHQNERFSKRQRPLNHGQANMPDQNDHFSKKQRMTSGSATNFRIENQREPSLLKKLLSSDINRDKKHLLQVFRFMVMNSFFKNLPEKPLKFPEVIVKEAGDDSVIIEEKAEVWKGDSSNASTEKITEIVSNDEIRVLGGDAVGCGRNDIDYNGGKVEEEGEIVD